MPLNAHSVALPWRVDNQVDQYISDNTVNRLEAGVMFGFEAGDNNITIAIKGSARLRAAEQNQSIPYRNDSIRVIGALDDLAIVLANTAGENISGQDTTDHNGHKHFPKPAHELAKRIMKDYPTVFKNEESKQAVANIFKDRVIDDTTDLDALMSEPEISSALSQQQKPLLESYKVANAAQTKITQQDLRNGHGIPARNEEKLQTAANIKGHVDELSKENDIRLEKPYTVDTPKHGRIGTREQTYHANLDKALAEYKEINQMNKPVYTHTTKDAIPSQGRSAIDQGLAKYRQENNLKPDGTPNDSKKDSGKARN